MASESDSRQPVERTPAEPSTPSEGTRQSEGKSEPVAWRAYDTDGSEAVYSLYEQARAAADEMNWSVEPLYPSPTLTHAEREAIVTALAFLREEADEPGVAQDAATLRGLLDRTQTGE